MERNSCLLCFLCLAFGSTVQKVQGKLDLSVLSPTHTIEYHGYHVDIFKDTSVTSEPAFYYTPASVLLRNGTMFSAKDTHPRYFTIKIGLWDEEYTQHIRSYLAKTDGIPNPRIRPVPFKWMRIDAIDNWQIAQFGTKWKSITNRPKMASFRVRCWSDTSCDRMEESLATDCEYFASNVHLAFAYRPPNTTNSALRIQINHLQASQTYQKISTRYPEAGFVYLHKADFDDLVREVLKASVMASFHDDQFVDDGQVDGLLNEYSRKLLHNTTSTAQFTESMWNVTFWSDESQRPDVRAKDLEALFSNGENWLKRVLRGDNVTCPTGISESSPSVAEAIAELRAAEGYVQWSGSDIIVKPFRLWCVNFGTLRGEESIAASSAWVTKRSADYLTAAHFARRKTPEPMNAMIESGMRTSHLNRSFELIFQLIGNLTATQLQTHMSSAALSKNATTEIGIGFRHVNQTFEKIFQTIGDLTGTVLQNRANSAAESKNARAEVGTGFSSATQTFEKVLRKLENLTNTVTGGCRSLGLKGTVNATWLMRDADTLWSLNHTATAATVRYAQVGLMELGSDCQVQKLTGTTNAYGEISLLLPRRRGLQMLATFEIAGYYPITLRDVPRDGDSDALNIFMEPLLFIPSRFTGSGISTGTLRDLSTYTALSGVSLDFRSDINSHTGLTVESVTTSGTGIWNVILPGGHYTVTASKTGYITVPFTVTVIGGKSQDYGVTGLSPILDNGAIRIVSLGGNETRNIYLPVHVRGPVEGRSERFHFRVGYNVGSANTDVVKREVGQYEMQGVLVMNQLAGICRISVSDWNLITAYRSGTLWDMANLGARIQLYTGNKLWAQYYMPNRMGNAWSVVEINGTHLNPVNEVNTVTDVNNVN